MSSRKRFFTDRLGPFMKEQGSEDPAKVNRPPLDQVLEEAADEYIDPLTSVHEYSIERYEKADLSCLCEIHFAETTESNDKIIVHSRTELTGPVIQLLSQVRGVERMCSSSRYKAVFIVASMFRSTEITRQFVRIMDENRGDVIEDVRSEVKFFVEFPNNKLSKETIKAVMSKIDSLSGVQSIVDETHDEYWVMLEGVSQLLKVLNAIETVEGLEMCLPKASIYGRGLINKIIIE